MQDKMRKAARKSIVQSTHDYESWLGAQLDGELVEKDLAEKHAKMRTDAFTFLRATYWRWAETIYSECPQLHAAPEVLAIGDIHLENFGVWRDADGRLVWGVNDFDEAARMPYALDLVRLAVSAILAAGEPRRNRALCDAILRGYGEGLEAPAAFVLDRGHDELRKQFEMKDRKRAKFWDDIDKEQTGAKKEAQPPSRYRKAIKATLPESGIELALWAKAAGTGSLGRPRWRALGEWRGAPVLREAKAIVPSAWTRASGKGKARIRCGEIASGKFRAPDPWYAAGKRIVVRRLSANSRKLEIDKHGDSLLEPMMLHCMGHELANVHLGTADEGEDLGGAIAKHLSRCKAGWLDVAARKMAHRIESEHEAWKLAYQDEDSFRRPA